ncbi:MAG: hypothetical protein ACKVQC_05845 [Elusimicrobiota bacterium]
MLTCREFAEKEGFQRLIGLARGESYRVKRDGKEIDLYPDLDLIFEALKLLLAYGIGKPAQLLNVTHNVDSLADWAHRYFAAVHSPPLEQIDQKEKSE